MFTKNSILIKGTKIPITQFTALTTYPTKNSFIYVNKIQQDATICRYLFTAKLLYMIRVSSRPSSEHIKL